jgi:hypothetical protein
MNLYYINFLVLFFFSTHLIMEWIWTLLSLCSVWMPILVILSFIPGVSANPLGNNPFPFLYFKEFSEFILDNFDDKISLQTTLIILFSLLENPDLIALHARHQVSVLPGEHKYKMSGWMNSFSRLLLRRLKQLPHHLFSSPAPYDREYSDDISRLSVRMENMAKLLQLYPYRDNGTKKPTTTFSHSAIEPIYIICPSTNICETSTCKPYGLQCSTRDRDVPQAQLIKGSNVCNHAYVLSGQCKTCKITYTADSEHDTQSECYVNSAKYLKLGTATWGDRRFCAGVVNGMYSFHASTAAYMEYWNNSYATKSLDFISRRQVWQAFVQESIRTIATDTGSSLTVQNNLPIDELTREAFNHLGSNGVIQPAHGHMCNECTQEYKERADVLPGGQIDQDVGEEYHGSNGSVASSEEEPQRNHQAQFTNPVKMVVVDGIVMGTLVSFCDFCLICHSNCMISVVHFRIVLESWRTTEVMHSVLNTRCYGDYGVE